MATEPTNPGEEINLSEPGRPETAGEQTNDQIIKPKHGDLSSAATPGLSNSQLLDLVLEAPVDQLIPWEDVRLPSRGFWYRGWDNDGWIRVRPMSQRADKILATDRLAKSGQAIDQLFRECCLLPQGSDPLDLIAGDRIFLLFYLRGITHGPNYEFAVTCPNPDCGAVSTHSYDLNELSRTIIWGNETLGPEPFKVALPYLSEVLGREFWVEVRFMRARDGQEMLAIRNTKKRSIAKPTPRTGRAGPPQHERALTVDETLNENLESLIVSIMGERDRLKIKSFVRSDKLHSEDTAAIREWMRENMPGIETLITVSCIDCGMDFMIQLPLTESFFRPQKHRGAAT